MEQLTGLDFKIAEMAARIKELREITRFTPAEMAEKTGVTVEEYLNCEAGLNDLNFAFIYRCALAFGVDVTDIIEGQSPRLQSYIVTKKGAGQRVDQAHGMTYFNLAAAFQNRIAEPLYVRSDYNEDAQHKDIELTTHAGQEVDIVISGHLMVQVGHHKEVLGPGDSIYYDSGTPHGMIAVNGSDCCFLAMILSGEKSEEEELSKTIVRARTSEKLLCEHFVHCTETPDGTPTSIRFTDEDKYNFAFDTVDKIGVTYPDKLALLHISEDMTERWMSRNCVSPQACSSGWTGFS